MPSGSPSNPLWIFAALLALCEVATVTVTILGSGWIRGVFAIFAVVFPVGITAVFVWLLVKHTSLLYAPGDYAGGVTFNDFHSALSMTREKVDASRQEATFNAVRDSIQELTEDSGAADKVIERAQLELRARAIKVVNEERDLRFEIDLPELATVQDLLDALWLDHLNTVVPVRSYGLSWLILKNGHAVRKSQKPLAEAGLALGDELELQFLDTPR